MFRRLLISFCLLFVCSTSFGKQSLPTGHFVVGKYRGSEWVAAIAPGFFNGMAGVSFKFGDWARMMELAQQYTAHGFLFHDARHYVLSIPGNPGTVDPMEYAVEKFFPAIPNRKAIGDFLFFLVRGSKVKESPTEIELCFSSTCRYYREDARLEILRVKNRLLQLYSLDWSR